MKRLPLAVGLLSDAAFARPTARIFAQNAPGRITGGITRAEDTLPLQGVRVTVVGTQTMVTTNPEGRYTINNLAPGLHRIRASAIGYTPVIVDSIPVVAGQSVTAD